MITIVKRSVTLHAATITTLIYILAYLIFALVYDWQVAGPIIAAGVGMVVAFNLGRSVERYEDSTSEGDQQ